MSWNYLASLKTKTCVPKGSSQAGFGLIELIVSISIMLIVAGVVFARHSSFNSAVLLRGQAYQVALQIREVQLDAVSAEGDAGNFRSVLGLYFDTNSLTNQHYHIFRDSPGGNNSYDPAEEYGKQGIIDKKFEIREIRVDGVAEPDLSITFVRPNFDAVFYDSGALVNAGVVEIDVARRDVAGAGVDVLRTIEVTSTGQISVK